MASRTPTTVSSDCCCRHIASEIGAFTSDRADRAVLQKKRCTTCSTQPMGMNGAKGFDGSGYVPSLSNLIRSFLRYAVLYDARD